jgi:serine/threonine protein kinase/tetratricopeptide (TPR) repeat protein
VIFGKYQLLEIIGHGGMAEVFKAKSYGVEGFEKLLVIKRILPKFADNSRFVEMFINEAKISVSLNHANVVQVFDLGKVGESYYIAMEYVHGMDLANVIRSCKRLGRKVPVELIAFIGSEVAKGLDYAHRRRDNDFEPLNIIHRDISPHNIIVSFEGEVKITDFGIAQAKNTLKEDKGTIKGKHAYMAPEQTLGQEHDRRVDIFSLGVVLYETIAQKNPLRGNKVPGILRRAQNKEYPSLTEIIGSELSEELAGIVAKAMEPNPDDRFGDAGELYEALVAYMYNARARMGVHSLAKFMEEIAGEDKEAFPDKNIVLDIVEGTGSASGVGSGVTDYASEITSVQVPASGGSSVVGTDTSTTGSTTGPGTRILPTEVREITVLAMEFAGGIPSQTALDRFHDIISNSGGMVVQERDDLLVALFGLEIADGRDTQDAIGTALRLQRAAGVHEDSLGLQPGVGVYPEKIVLMADGTPREDDTYLNVVSIARNLAQRGIGWVITSDNGRVLASDKFEFEDITVTSIDNVEQTVCKVIGRRAAAESYGKFLGRREELRKVGEILATVSRGSGRMVTLIGEAGTGKTRVVREVQRRLASGGHDIGWYEAICVPWRKSTPFAAIASMFRSILGVSEIEPEVELKAKVKRLRELGLSPEEVESVAVLLGVARDSDIASEKRGRQIRAAVIRAVSSLCSDKMTVFFFDDLSYIDNESLSVLKYLGKAISYMPALVFVAFRSGLEKEFDNDLAYNPVVLHPLSEKDSKRLARHQIRASHVPEELLIDIALKSGGNPLYIEEYVKALLVNDVVRVKSGEAIYHEEASLVEFPKTLRGLVGARVKRLPAEQHGLLQRASVVGQRFDVRLFSAVTEVEVGVLRAILLGLIDAGVISRVSANEYAFTSGMVRDVVYDGIVLSDRRDIHVAVARSMEELFSERLDEFVEKIAVHYQKGGDKLKAVDYLILAGEKVSDAYSNEAALDYYLTAMEILRSVPQSDFERMLDVYIPIGELAMKTAKWDLGIEKMRLAEELAEELGDKQKLFQVMRVSAELHVRSDKHIEAQHYFKKAIDLADELGDKGAMSSIHAVAGQVYNRIGDMKNAIHYYREATSLSSETADRSYVVSIMSSWAIAEAVSGNLEDADAIMKYSEALIDDETSPVSRCKYDGALGTYYYMAGEKEKSLSHQSKVIEIGKEYGLKDIIAKHAHTLGDTYLLLGDYRKAYTFLRTSLEISEELGYDILINLNQIYLAFIDAMKFGSDDGLQKLKNSLDLANKRDNIWEQLQVHYFLGKIYFEQKQYDHAVSHLRQAVRIGRTANNIRYEAKTMDLLEQIKEARSEN